MANEGFKRKLAAILSADVEGYSRLMDNDEEATVRTLTAYRTAINDLVQQYRGRVVDAPGDNILAEFTSVVDAVNCAVEIQRELAERNAELPYNRKMEFRIGVNLGDVIEEEGRIYGDGVNIAARVETLSKAGGICISGRAYDQVENKLGLEYENLGEHQVKNITRPIRVYRVLSFPGAAAHRVVQAKETLGRKWRKIAFATVAVVVVVVVILGIWQFYMHRPSIEPASLDKMAYPLPDKPSIAVLPFDNLSGDPEQEFFSDGLSEELITALSKVPKLFVIARNSTFTYKGKPVKVQQVSEELGVRYILEGSVRQAKDRVRITAQLIDALTGHHLWAESYNRTLKDIFVLQDEITMKILTALRVQLTEGEYARLLERHTNNLQAYLKILEGSGYWRVSKYSEAMKCFEEAVSLDPQCPPAYGWLSWTHLMNVWFGPSATRKQSLKKAFEFAERCRALDDTHGGCHGALGHAYLLKGDYDKAISEGKRAVELDPNTAMWAAHYGMTLRCIGRYEDALREYERALRLNPLDTGYALFGICTTYNMMRRHEEAIETCKKVIELSPRSLPAHISLAVAYSELEQMDEARKAAGKVLKLNPNFSVESFGKTLPYKNKADRDLFVRGLRKAGMK
jgi:TolB-like protein/class 3 adenylate cyclase